jgi:hypothetical protein
MEYGYDISYLTDNVIKNKNNYNNDSHESKKKKEKQTIIRL